MNPKPHGLSDELCKFLGRKIRRKRIERASPDSRKVDSFVSSAKLVKRNFPPRETRISTIKSLEAGSWRAAKFSCKFHREFSRTHARTISSLLIVLARLTAICRRRYFFPRRTRVVSSMSAATGSSTRRVTRLVGRASASSPWFFVGNKRLERQERESGTRWGEGEEKRERERLNRRAKRGREKQRGRITIR